MIRPAPTLFPDGTPKLIFNPQDYESVPSSTVQQLANYANKYTNNIFTNDNTFNNVNITGTLTKGNVTDGEFNDLDGLIGPIQTQLDGKQPLINSSNRLNANLIGSGSVSNTQYSYLDATSSIQTQLNAKANLANPTFTGTINANGGITLPTGQTLTIVGDISANATTITPTELSYLDGVTSNLQTQLNSVGIGTSSTGTYSTISGATGTLTFHYMVVGKMAVVSVDATSITTISSPVSPTVSYSFVAYAVQPKYATNVLVIASGGTNANAQFLFQLDNSGNIKLCTTAGNLEASTTYSISPCTFCYEVN